MSVVTIVRAAALGVAIAFGVAVAATAMTTPAAMDFVAQYAAARLVATGDGAAVLDPDAVLAAERTVAPERVRLLPFVQPPAVALLISPLAVLPYGSAFLVMAILDAAAIAAAVVLLRRRDAPLLPAALLLAGPPAVLAIAHGQTSAVVLLLVALTARVGPRGAGLALGLTLLRPQTAPLLLLAAVIDPARRWWAVLGASLVVLASMAVVGPDGLARYGTSLVGAAEWSVTGEHGLRAAIGWSGTAIWLSAGPLGLVAAVAALLVGAVMVIRAPPAERVSIAALLSLLASPHVLMHDALLAYPALLALAVRRAPWDAASVLAWMAHVLIAPLGVLWTLVLSIRSLGYTLARRRPPLGGG